MQGFNRSFMNLLRLGFAVLVVFWSAAFSNPALLAQSVDSLPKPTDYVSDYAHVLSPAAIERLDSICTQLDHSQANTQVAVVTVRTLNGEDEADYASQLEDKWKIGKKGSDRGVLILLAVNDHKRRIDVGYGLEGILPDAKLGDIGREMVPYLRANDFDRAELVAVGQIAEVVAEDAKISLNDEPAQIRSQRQVHHGNSIVKIIVIILVLVFFGGSWIFRLLFGLSLFSGFGGRGGWGGGGGGWGGGSGGGGGGGSGFGGFGGGDFGGGGAGGDW